MGAVAYRSGVPSQCQHTRSGRRIHDAALFRFADNGPGRWPRFHPSAQSSMPMIVGRLLTFGRISLIVRSGVPLLTGTSRRRARRAAEWPPKPGRDDGRSARGASPDGQRGAPVHQQTARQGAASDNSARHTESVGRTALSGPKDAALACCQSCGPGGQARYTNAAIPDLPDAARGVQAGLRQIEGLTTSVLPLMGPTISAPDHTTISRRAATLRTIRATSVPHGPLHVLIDSTGLQVYGAGQWLEAKHGAKSRRKWRKLHLSVDAATGMIVARTLTDQVATIRPRSARCSIRLTNRLAR